MLDFYKGKTVFVTGHTGFKGTWLCAMLVKAGAKVIGYSRCSEKEERLFDICGIENDIIHIKGDVRDYGTLLFTLIKYRPEIVIHMAAQPIVREGYKDPMETYMINAVGTLNLLEAMRRVKCVKSFLNVTTDTVYDNKEWDWGYRESDALNGADPYSNSKSCSELITSSYARSYFEGLTAVSTARAGNVIGGGDFAKDRIIPDCVRAAAAGREIVLRNPDSIRPYQHVIEALYAYLMIAQKQYEDPSLAGPYNVGPESSSYIKTSDLVRLFVREWGEDTKWTEEKNDGPKEAGILKLDNSKIAGKIGWKPVWNIEKAVEKTVELSKCIMSDEDIRGCMNRQIAEYEKDRRKVF